MNTELFFSQIANINWIGDFLHTAVVPVKMFIKLNSSSNIANMFHHINIQVKSEVFLPVTGSYRLNSKW